MNLHDNELQHLVESYVERGVAEGFEQVWPDAERRVRAILGTRVAFRNETLPRQIEQAKRKVESGEKCHEGFREDLAKVKQSMLDGWSGVYYWATLILWILITGGEMLAFPVVYRDVFDMPLNVGSLFCFVFPAASLFVKGVLYKDLSERWKRLFRRIRFGLWGISVVVFTFSFLTARTFILDNQRQMAALSLSGSSGTNFLIPLQLISFIGLWFFGLTTAIGLAILHDYYRQPKDRLDLMEGELCAADQQLREHTTAYTDLVREAEGSKSLIEDKVLAVKNALQTLILQEEKRISAMLYQEKEKMFRRRYPRLFVDMAPLAEGSQTEGKVRGTQVNGRRNGKAKVAGIGATLALAVMVLAGPRVASTAPNVFIIQDIARSPDVVEKDFQGFGRVVLEMPVGGTVTLFGSDGVEYIQGCIDGTYTGKIQRQRQALIGQGRAFYQRIQQRQFSKNPRDYASAIAEIVPRMQADAILILQGKPLYMVDPVTWDERIPSISWAFHPASPFGERAIKPAPVRFRAVAIFAPDDFVSPNHRAEIERFWRILFGRLNGDLVLFTTDAGAVVTLLSQPGISTNGPRPDMPGEQERNAPLRLEGVTRLGITQ